MSATAFLDEVLGALRDQNVHTSPMGGVYVSNSRPATPDQFKSVLQGIKNEYEPNNWDLGFVGTTEVGDSLADAMITWGTAQYAALYDSWLAADLNVSASADVKDWYTTEKAARKIG